MTRGVRDNGDGTLTFVADTPILTTKQFCEDYPELGAIIKALAGRIDMLSSRLLAISGCVNEQQENNARSARLHVDAALNAVRLMEMVEAEIASIDECGTGVVGLIGGLNSRVDGLTQMLEAMAHSHEAMRERIERIVQGVNAHTDRINQLERGRQGYDAFPCFMAPITPLKPGDYIPNWVVVCDS